MAERRMFSKKITDTDVFLSMPLSTQALYFHMNMHADDDGFVDSVLSIQRMIGANDDDLKILIAKQFVFRFQSGVVLIRDWKIHNYIAKDRYHKTLHQGEFNKLSTDDSGMYTECIQPVDVGKVRLGKDSQEDVSGVSTKNEIDIENVLTYLNEKTGKKFKSSSSKNISLIKSLFKEGYQLKDFKKVIDLKVSDWLEDTKMNEYLRPSTLFNKTHFEEYINKIPQGHVLNLNHIPTAEELKGKGQWA
ncbi:DNA replication protein [Oenococcus sicerae]|uniref:DNA replication protein n=1 Tax=Oenococcus sicerae TaxID=2203724 RepID=A0ABX5QN71_9LACO|nr:conserved phage C-terminal domain-containing protein [Oenococcus sicerae]QAS70238.1 DNA replication protein [Oenococcus sicerae]